MSLPISSIVDVSVSVTPSAPPKIGFGIAAMVTSELPISGIQSLERVVYYNSITELGVDYSNATEVYISANIYFSQSPSPTTIAVISQYLIPTKSILYSGTTVDNNIATWIPITDGSFTMTLSDLTSEVLGVDFTAVTSMDDVAANIQTALNAAAISNAFMLAVCVWDGLNNRFVITSGEVIGNITFTSIATSGSDISAQMKTESDQGGSIIYGKGVDTVIDALTAADEFDQQWYGIILVKSERDNQTVQDVSAWAESRTKLFCTPSHNPNTLLLNNEDNMAAILKGLNYQRSHVIYSSYRDEYMDAAIFGKAFTTDFSAPDSVISLKFKNLSGVTAEKLTSGQKAAIDDKRANSYMVVGNADMYGESFMSSQLFFDERHGIDWLVGELSYSVFVYMLTRITKVPGTDAGTASLVQQVIKVLDSAYSNGLIATGTTSEGEFLANGYKVSAGKVRDMPVGDKLARIAPTISFVALLSGAFHFVEIRGKLER